MRDVRILIPPRENAVLLATSLPLFLKIFKLASDGHIRTETLWLTAISILSCLLENHGLPVSLKRGGSPGLFYGLSLVPAVLLSIVMSQYSPTWDVSLTRSVFAESIKVSIWLLVYCSFSWRFRSGDWLIGNHLQSLILLLTTGIIVHFLFHMQLTVTLLFHMCSSLICIEAASTYLPNCFTYGELLLLVNLAVPMLSSFNAFYLLSPISLVTNWALFFVVLFLASLCLLLMIGVMSPWVFYSSGILLLVCLVSVLFESLPQGFLMWTVEFVRDNWPTRQFLLLLWLTEILTCAAYVTCFRATNMKSSTSERKFFHVLILVTFIPGLLFDVSLLFFCSVGAVCVLMILEAMRVLQMPPLAKILNERFAEFVDPQDSGQLILTPIYLLLGQSLPIWAACLQDPTLLTSQSTVMPIAAYSGILSVGIGDTAASVVGSKCGRHKWAGSNKTMEGTAAAIIAQVVFIMLFVRQYDVSLLAAVVASVAISLIEAFTSQIDNLVLPIYMYFLLNATRLN